LQPEEIENFLKSVQQKIVSGHFDEALSDLGAFQSSQSSQAFNPEAVYMTAVCHRYSGDYTQSLETLEVLKNRVPDHGRAHQEEGHTLRKMGKDESALAAFERATSLNPALTASWKAQIEIARATGLHPKARYAESQLKRMQAMPKVLLAVVDLIAQGKLLKAEDICRQFLQKVPHHVEAMRLLATIGTKLGIYDDAELLLKGAVQLEPENDQLRIEFIQALRKRQNYAAATEQARLLLEKDPENPQFQSLYAVDCMQTGHFEEALDYFDRILETLPEDSLTWTSRGHAFKTLGNLEASIDSFHRAIRHQPGYGEAYYSLANLKTYKFDNNEIEAMLDQESNSNLSYMDRVYVNFALGKAFEDSHDYDRSFRYYEQGNALKKNQSRYRAEPMTEDLQAQQQVCTQALFESKGSAGCDAPDPIFILGLPRAGSTLLEQILSSHSQVDGTLELPNILSLSQRLRRRSRTSGNKPYPQILEELTSEELQEMGEEFIRDTRFHRQQAPFFIDKMPNNFRHIGLIKLILPNAKIIDARRNAMDCCFSGFKQLFAEGQEFSYSLEDIGTYYRDYVTLMAHWDEVLPGAVLQVNNEDVIDDLEGQVRRILDFCNLSFEETCLRYYETKRHIRTPSSEQVRKPVNRSGVGQWKHYAAHLQPLIKTLGPLSGQDVSRSS